MINDRRIATVRRGGIALWLGCLAGMLIGIACSLPWSDGQPVYSLPALETAQWIAADYPPEILAALKRPAPHYRFTPHLDRTVGFYRLPLNFSNAPDKVWFEWQTCGNAAIYWDGNRLETVDGADGRLVSDLIDLTALATSGTHVLAVSVEDKRIPANAAMRGVLHIRKPGGATERVITSENNWEASGVPYQNAADGLYWNTPSAKSPLLPLPLVLPTVPWANLPGTTHLPPGLMERNFYAQSRWRWQGRESGAVGTSLPGQPDGDVYLLVRATGSVFVHGAGEDGLQIASSKDWTAIPMKPDRKGILEWTVALPPSDTDAFLETGVWQLNPHGDWKPVPVISDNIHTSGPVRRENLVIAAPSTVAMGPSALVAPRFHWSWFLALTLSGGLAGWLVAGQTWRHACAQRAIIYGAASALGWLAMGELVQWSWFSSRPMTAHILVDRRFAFFAILAGAATGWFLRRPAPIPTRPDGIPRNGTWRGRAALAAVLVICISGMLIRWNQINVTSLDQDEMSMVITASAIPHYGVPGAALRNGFKALATYELVPYSLITGVTLNGWSEFGVRFHSFIYGSFSVLLLGIWGRRMFGPAAGWALMFIGAVMPWSVSMSSFAFYPAQLQFFILITLISFYEACRPVKVHMGWLAAGTVFFNLTYLSWEGSGFLLIGLAFGMVLIREKQWRQAFRPGFIAALLLIVSVVLLQRGYRILTGDAFYGVGPGLSSISPLAFLKNDGSVDPLFYVHRLLFLEHHWPYTVLFLASLPLAMWWRPYRFCVGVLFCMFVSYTFLLNTTALRYGYGMQSLLLGLGVGGAVILWRYLCALAENEPVHRRPNRPAAAAAVCLPWALTLFLATNSWIIPSDTIRPLGSESQTYALLDRADTDFRRACHVAGILKPKNERVIVTFPHVYRFYSGQAPDYEMQTTWKGKLIIFPNAEPPQIVERFGGIQTITNREQLAQVLAKDSSPIWLVLSPSSLAISLTQPEVWTLLNAGSEIIYSSSRALVLRFDPAKVPAKTWSTFQASLLPQP